MFEPSDWYWKRVDASFYSSARNLSVDKDDKLFAAWAANGRSPSRYPVDENGSESEAELAAVLLPYGVFVRLADYAAAKRFAIETGGFNFHSHPIATDRDSQSKIGNLALAANIVGPAFSTNFKCSDGDFFILDQAGALAMATAVMNFISGCFDAEATIAAAISARTIKTFADIDAAAWPLNHN